MTESSLDCTREPNLECDLIMKGGVTSGVIYPLAVCELAQQYRFRAVGGASAGAIAASVTAAAEFGRRTGGFDVLHALPKWTGETSPTGRSNLSELFQPGSRTARLYRVATIKAGGSLPDRIVRAVLGYWRGLTLGSVAGMALLAVVLTAASGGGRIAGSVAAAIVALVGAVVGLAVELALDVFSLSRNGFGMCNGMPENDAGPAALTPWLHGRIQEAAGRSTEDAPLTFGDLWQGPDGTGRLDDKFIDLQIMTTNLSEGRPQSMPWHEDQVYFDDDEMTSLFPSDVVEWMKRHPDVESKPGADSRRGLYPWPAAENLPVIVAARMSLSLPGLLSAVRLYKEVRIDRRRGERTLQPLWFSDGGICSNFPIHFFDGPLPSRPTFAIDLVEVDKLDEKGKNVYLPSCEEGSGDWAWAGIRGIGGFLMSIVETARTWVDNSASTMPGYRDRIVTVFHTHDEGGMNLEMPRCVVTKLSERGRDAGALLVDRYIGESCTDKPAPGWEDHRWTRYRTAMTAAEKWLRGYHSRYSLPDPAHARSYRQLLDPDSIPVEDRAFRFTKATELGTASKRTEGLASLTDQWFDGEDDGFSFETGSPSPHPYLRAMRPM